MTGSCGCWRTWTKHWHGDTTMAFDLEGWFYSTPGERVACLTPARAEADVACAVWSKGWLWFIVLFQLWQTSRGLPSRYPRLHWSYGLCTSINLFHFPPFHDPLPLPWSPPQQLPNYFFSSLLPVLLHPSQICQFWYHYIDNLSLLWS